MRISTKGRYSLEALLYLCLLPSTAVTSTHVVAKALSISEGYLEQLFIPLRKAGVLKGTRGSQGGYTLGRPPGRITLTDVLLEVEGPLDLVDCVNDKSCARRKNCPSREIWDSLYKTIRKFADTLTFAELTKAYRAMENGAYQI
ncbi:MAG: Rrf2 family transcriptional regulator [Treponema sp.]|jgi:Rrf2 family protein|nr:Rrf2 family transcriptional regulator [Treponema sp.]